MQCVVSSKCRLRHMTTVTQRPRKNKWKNTITAIFRWFATTPRCAAGIFKTYNTLLFNQGH